MKVRPSTIVPEILERDKIVHHRARGWLDRRQSLVGFQAYLKTYFPPKRIADMIRELAHAESPVYFNGEKVAARPDWPARQTGIKLVMQSLRLIGRDIESPTQIPTKVIFAVINGARNPKAPA